MIEVQPAYYPLYKNKDKFIILITGGRGSAKSFNASTFIERLSFEKGHKILFTRYTMTSASLSVIPEFREKIEKEGTDQYFNITQNEIENKVSGSLVMFRGVKTSSGNQTANLKSIQGLTTFVCDEAEEWTSESDYDKLVLSIRQAGIQNRIIIIMNPTDVNHFVYRKYIKDTHKIIYIDGVGVQISTHPNVLHIHTTYFDNINNLSQNFIDEVADILEKDSKKEGKYAHTVIGRWADIAEGVIFKDWEIVDEIPEYVKLRGLGLDFGYSIDPTAIVECGLIDDDLYLNEICYKTRMKTSEIATVLSPFNYKVMSESADPRLVDEIANHGINIYPVDKSGPSVKVGIKKMHDLNIKITKKSYNLLNEFRNYVFDKDKDGIYIDRPKDKQQDHLIDASRYWVLGEILGRLKGFSEMEKVENIDESKLSTHVILIHPCSDDYFVAISSYKFGSKILISDVIFNKDGTLNFDKAAKLFREDSRVLYESPKEWFEFGRNLREETESSMRIYTMKGNQVEFINSRKETIKDDIIFISDIGSLEYAQFANSILNYSDGDNISAIYAVSRLLEMYKDEKE